MAKITCTYVCCLRVSAEKQLLKATRGWHVITHALTLTRMEHGVDHKNPMNLSQIALVPAERGGGGIKGRRQRERGGERL